MALYHLHIDYVRRATGRNAVAAAAYRSGSKLYFERQKMTYDYSKRRGVANAEIVVPAGSNAGEWAFDRQKLWNKAENVEKRKDARTAWEIECALPHELDGAQRYDLAREYAQLLAYKTGAAVDFAIHYPVLEKGEHPKNHHVHYLLTTRKVEKNGFGEKVSYLRSEAWRKKNGHPNLSQQTIEIRKSWEVATNLHLAKAGLDVRVDHRSHEDRGFKMRPTKHVGVHATAMQRKGADVHRQRLNGDDADYNTALAHHEPGEIFRIITAEKSVFDRRDIARTIHRYTNLKDHDFQNLFARVMGDSELLELAPDSPDFPAQYTTQEVFEREEALKWWADRVASREHEMAQKHVDRAIARQDKQLHEIGASVTKEQRESVQHLTANSRLSILVGHAGTGKSTVLGMAADAWKAQGYRVIGCALSGKAAEGLEQSAGIDSQTLASLELEIKNGRKLTDKDVLVVDESGMLDNRQLQRLIMIGENHGAKVVLVGDPEQLQSIGAGGAFRALSETQGAHRLTEIRRQKVDWQVQASADFATQNTARALQAYMDHGMIKFGSRGIVGSVIKDYATDFKQSPDETRLAIAHTKKQVRQLNAGIRSKLQAEGHLEMKGEKVYRTSEGMKSFVPGDRVLLGANDRQLGLKNGMFATVEKCGQHAMRIILDGSNRKVVLPMRVYRAVAHGYACTVHKAQGATVDSTYVLASRGMDRHMTYVAMTRHRNSVKMYANNLDFFKPEDLKSTLARGNTKKSTLDFLNDFGARRGVETTPQSEWISDSKPYKGWQNRQENMSPVDTALDYYGLAMEERVWLDLHGVPAELMPEEKLNTALIMLEKAQPGLRQTVIDTVKHYGQPLDRMFIWPDSSEDRVKIIREAIADRQGRKNAMSGEYPPRAPEPYPEPKPKPKPEPEYEPGPAFRM